MPIMEKRNFCTTNRIGLQISANVPHIITQVCCNFQADQIRDAEVRRFYAALNGVVSYRKTSNMHLPHNWRPAHLLEPYKDSRIRGLGAAPSAEPIACIVLSVVGSVSSSFKDSTTHHTGVNHRKRRGVAT